jgi:type I restriction enzyme S subunit
MSEWKKVKLKDVSINITDGKHGDCKGQDGSGYYFVSCKDVYDGDIHYENARQITKEDFDDADKRTKLAPNDILITNSGTIGRMAFVKNQFETRKTTFQKSVAIVKPDDSKVYPLYLYYLLKSKVNDFVNSSNGAAQKNLLLSTMRDFDLHIEDNIIKLLEEAAQRLYKEWFVDLHFPGHENTKIVDGVPEGWEKKKLIDLVDVQYGYAFDGKLFNSNGEGMPILRIRNIPDGITSDYTTEEASESYIVHNGDIVVGMDGIFHINSWNGGDAYLVQRACSFRPKEESARGFIFQAIQEPIKYFEQTLVGATVAHLGKKHIDSIELIVPENKNLYIPFQRRFKQRQSLLSQIRLLTEARDRLLPKLMSGEIAV